LKCVCRSTFVAHSATATLKPACHGEVPRSGTETGTSNSPTASKHRTEEGGSKPAVERPGLKCVCRSTFVAHSATATLKPACHGEVPRSGTETGTSNSPTASKHRTEEGEASRVGSSWLEVRLQEHIRPPGPVFALRQAQGFLLRPDAQAIGTTKDRPPGHCGGRYNARHVSEHLAP
jgi:hypothetical protein